MATAPVLGGNTLPHPDDDGFQVTYGYRGASREMADGSVVTDLVQTNGKRKIALTWSMATDAQRVTLQTAFDTVKNATASFTDPNNATYNVTRDTQAGDLQMQVVKTAETTLRWHIVMTLREV